MALGVQEAAITAQNTFTSALFIPNKQSASLSISGTFVATVTHQRRKQGGSVADFKDVETFTAAAEKITINAEGMEHRIGVKTGDFTSGTVDIRLAWG